MFAQTLVQTALCNSLLLSFKRKCLFASNCQQPQLREPLHCSLQCSSVPPSFLPLNSCNVVSAADFSVASLDPAKSRILATLPGCSAAGGIPGTTYFVLWLWRGGRRARDGGGGGAAWWTAGWELRNRWSISVCLPPDLRGTNSLPLPSTWRTNPSSDHALPRPGGRGAPRLSGE